VQFSQVHGPGRMAADWVELDTAGYALGYALWPRQHTPSNSRLSKRMFVARVLATDNDPRTRSCARETWSARLGSGRCVWPFARDVDDLRAGLAQLRGRVSDRREDDLRIAPVIGSTRGSQVMRAGLILTRNEARRAAARTSLARRRSRGGPVQHCRGLSSNRPEHRR